LLGPDPSQTSKSFANAHDILGKARPELSINNFHDALNVAVVSWVFTQPRQHKTGKRPIPFLISRTRRITDLALFQTNFSLPTEQELSLINHDLYLFIETEL